MTCNDMLELMLEADVEELEGHGPSALAQHVRTCARCREVARTIVGDSQLLAVAVRRSAPIDLASFAARTRFSRRTLVGGAIAAIAASVVLAVLVQNAMHATDTLDAPMAIVHRPVSPAPGVAPSRLEMNVRPPEELNAPLIPAGARPVEPRRFADAAPVVPVEFNASVASVDTSSVSGDEPVVTVTPPPGRRATVWRGRSPKITVVWLY